MPLKDYFEFGVNADYSKLNEFVDCRNEIAHGANYENIWSMGMFLDYLDFVVFYAEAFTNYLNDKLLQECWEKYSEGKVVKPEKYYSKQNVFVFHLNDILLSKQQKMLIKQPDGNYPRYFECYVPEIYCKRPETSKEMIKKVDILYGDGEWLVSIKLPLSLSPKSRFFFENL